MSTSEYTGGYEPPPSTVPPSTPFGGGPPADPPASPPEPAGRSAPWRRRGPRSLTSKITLFVVSLVVVLVAVVGAATYYSLQGFLHQRFDQQLESTASQNAVYIQKCKDDQGGGYSQQFACPYSAVSREEWLGALDPYSGRYLQFFSAGNDEVRRLNLTRAQQQELARLGPDESFTVRVDNEKLLVRADRTPDGLIVATGLSTDEVDRTLRRLVLVEVIIGSAAVLLAVFVTTAGVRFSLRRLRRVTATAEDVALELSPEGTGLDRRVPDDEPDTEVGQLATSFNTMLSAVQTQFAARVESERRMRQFLADASHELRTPLTSIRGYAELARMQRAAGDTSADNLDRIEFEGTRMSRLVEDLLLLARNEGDDGDASRPLARELVEVAGLVDDAVVGVRAAFAEREIVVDAVDPNAYVLGDPDQLLRVLRNLLTNAAVHTAPERPIRITAFTDDHGVTVQVADGGPGLPPDEAAHIFERFWRADKARTRARGGSGLGMSIVATIVRRHGGTVRFDSSVEAGSTVTVWLPGVQPGE